MTVDTIKPIPTDTEQALSEAKRDIESAISAAAERLRVRTGLFATVQIETLDIDTQSGQGRLYIAKLKFSV